MAADVAEATLKLPQRQLAVAGGVAPLALLHAAVDVAEGLVHVVVAADEELQQVQDVRTHLIEALEADVLSIQKPGLSTKQCRSLRSYCSGSRKCAPISFLGVEFH